MWDTENMIVLAAGPFIEKKEKKTELLCYNS